MLPLEYAGTAPPIRPYDKRRAALVVHRFRGLAAAVCEDRDAARAAVALLDGIIADARKPTVDLSFEDWRASFNAINAALWAFPTRFPISHAAALEAFMAADAAFRHRHNDRDWEDFDVEYRRSIIKPIARLRSKIKAHAVSRYFAAFEGRHAA